MDKVTGLFPFHLLMRELSYSLWCPSAWNCEGATGISGVLRSSSELGPGSHSAIYNDVLDVIFPSGCSILCYTNDTVVVASGDDFNKARVRTKLGVFVMIGTIERLGCV